MKKNEFTTDGYLNPCGPIPVLNSSSLCYIVLKVGRCQITKDLQCQIKEIDFHKPGSNIYKL